MPNPLNNLSIPQLFENGCSARFIASVLDLPYQQIIKLSVPIKSESFNLSRLIELYDFYLVSLENLSVKFNLPSDQLIRLLSPHVKIRTGADLYRFFFFDDEIFDTIDTPTKAYWLGFMFADGHNGKKHNVRLRLKYDDENHLHKYAAFLNFKYGRYRLTRRKKYESEKCLNYHEIGLAVKNQHFSEQLAKLGCSNNKSFTLTYPDYLSNDLHSHFIRGIFEADGGFTKGYNKRKELDDWGASLVSTQEICAKIKEIIETKLDIYLGMSCISKTQNNTWELRCTGNLQVEKFCNFLYQNAPWDTVLDRKYVSYCELLQFNQEKLIKDQERLQRNLDIKHKLQLGSSIAQLKREYNLSERTLRRFQRTF